MNNVPIIYAGIFFQKKRGHKFEELDTINVELNKLVGGLEILEYLLPKVWNYQFW